jgi:hypothetical protein
MGILGDMAGFLGGTVVLSLLLIALGLAYFMLTLWTLKTGAGLLDLAPDANWLVLGASLISAASIVGSGRHNYY